MFVWDDDDLNDEQGEAIAEPNSVFLVACPGSGKTRTLTYKIAKELTELEEKNKWVIAITYTHRAADEIKDRIEHLGVDTSQLWIGTIHAFCIEWILKPYGCYHNTLKYGYSIINSFDSEEYIAEICSNYTNPKVTYYDCNHYFSSQGIIYSSCSPAQSANVKSVIEDYHLLLLEANLVDFEQILLFAYQLIQAEPSISKILGNIFKYILVDEYQDTKEIQYSIFSEILKARRYGVKAFIVGDPNQAIYGSLGGYAISLEELNRKTGIQFIEKKLNKNYRSSGRIISHFENYKVYNSEIIPEGVLASFQSNLTFDTDIHKDNLAEHIANLIRCNIEELGVSENEICIVAPWWIHLASMTRKLISLLPNYSFNGPGMTPFARDEDNFWYKVTKLALTVPSPALYRRRLRWAGDLILDLENNNFNVDGLTPKILLRIFNSIHIDEEDGLKYLGIFFDELIVQLNFDIGTYSALEEHLTSFFESALKRIERIKSENEQYAGGIEDFKKVFVDKSGITVSTIHGVKGAEFDVVIAYGLLEGIVPHFSDADPTSGNKLLYVIGSRARKHLHLISEEGRGNLRYPKYPTNILAQHVFDYD
jgi:DNA helicase-2/ATP-dependent DNA helicase PcrA